MSAITRRMRLRAGAASICPPKWNGKSLAGPANSTTPSESSGSGPAALTRPTPVTVRPKARSANTMASSWSTSWCCAAHRWLRLPDTAALPIVTSSIPITAGSLPGCALPTTPTRIFGIKAAQQGRVRESVMNVRATALAEVHDVDEISAFARDVIDDLSRHPKRLSPKYFYDAAGSELFEEITRLPEYYPTRTELAILKDRGRLISAIIPEGAALVEFGAG